MSWAEAVSLAKDLWWILSVPLASAGLFAMYYLRGQFISKADYKKDTDEFRESISNLKERVDSSEKHTGERLTRIEGDVRNLPGRPEMELLSDRVGRVEVQVAASVETIKGVDKTTSKIDHTLGMILDHMLDAAKEKSS